MSVSRPRKVLCALLFVLPIFTKTKSADGSRPGNLTATVHCGARTTYTHSSVSRLVGCSGVEGNSAAPCRRSPVLATALWPASRAAILMWRQLHRAPARSSAVLPRTRPCFAQRLLAAMGVDAQRSRLDSDQDSDQNVLENVPLPRRPRWDVNSLRRQMLKRT